MQSVPALIQLEQGDRLLQRTLRRRQVIQLRELASGAARGAVGAWRALGELSLAVGEAFNPSGEAELYMAQGSPHSSLYHESWKRRELELEQFVRFSF